MRILIKIGSRPLQGSLAQRDLARSVHATTERGVQVVIVHEGDDQASGSLDLLESDDDNRGQLGASTTTTSATLPRTVDTRLAHDLDQQLQTGTAAVVATTPGAEQGADADAAQLATQLDVDALLYLATDCGGDNDTSPAMWDAAMQASRQRPRMLIKFASARGPNCVIEALDPDAGTTITNHEPTEALEIIESFVHG